SSHPCDLRPLRHHVGRRYPRREPEGRRLRGVVAERANGDPAPEGGRSAFAVRTTESTRKVRRGSVWLPRLTPRLAWLRGSDLNGRPLGYEPNELPGCSTPR